MVGWGLWEIRVGWCEVEDEEGVAESGGQRGGFPRLLPKSDPSSVEEEEEEEGSVPE